MDFTKSTVEWVRRALTANRLRMPSEIDTARLHRPPEYTPDFVQLVRRLLDQSQDARYLPLAVERMQFGSESDDVLLRYKAAANSAEGLAALVRAFIARTFKVASKLAAPVRGDLVAAYRTPSNAVTPAASASHASKTSPSGLQKQASSRRSSGDSAGSGTGGLKEGSGAARPTSIDDLADHQANAEQQPMLPGTTPERPPAPKEPEGKAGSRPADASTESGPKPKE
jgi:hypothetical protein